MLLFDYLVSCLVAVLRVGGKSRGTTVRRILLSRPALRPSADRLTTRVFGCTALGRWSPGMVVLCRRRSCRTSTPSTSRRIGRDRCASPRAADALRESRFLPAGAPGPSRLDAGLHPHLLRRLARAWPIGRPGGRRACRCQTFYCPERRAQAIPTPPRSSAGRWRPACPSARSPA